MTQTYLQYNNPRAKTNAKPQVQGQQKEGKAISLECKKKLSKNPLPPTHTIYTTPIPTMLNPI